MNYTITCPGCGSKLKLFDSQVKQKQGFIRCTRCGQKIKYDLTKPDPVGTGFWADTEVPFKVGAQKRFLSIAKARQARVEKGETPLPLGTAALPDTSTASRIPQAFDRSQNHFQKFDMKTGQIIGETASPAATRPAKAQDFQMRNLPAQKKPVTTPPKPAKPMTETMRKLEELKHSLDTYTVTRSAPSTTPKPVETPSIDIRKPANIPITDRKAARHTGNARHTAAIRPIHLTSKSFPKLQPAGGFVARIKSLLAGLMGKK